MQVTKADLIRRVKTQTGMTEKEVADVLNVIIQEMMNHLKKGNTI